MEENVISLISKLSNSFMGAPDVNKSLKERKKHKVAVKQVSRVAFDVIRRCEKREESFVVGKSEWYPEIWISDYAYELMNNGNTRASEILLSSLNQINQKSFESLNEIWKFLLQLKEPFEEKNIVQHPFSLSGQDYFFRSHNPYKLLPDEIIGSKSIEEETSRLKIGSLEDNIFLDLFVEKYKPTVTVQKTLCLNDFLDDKINNLPITHIKPVINENKALKTKTGKPKKCTPPGSDVENVLKGDDFQGEFVKHAGTFIKSYEDSLTLDQNDTFALKNRRTKEKASNLVLGIYLEDVALKQLIDPTLKIEQPKEIQLEDYVSQVKYLLCGINTNIFMYDETSKKFYMKVGVYIDKLSPSTLFEVSQIHLRTGSCLKFLTELVEYHLKDNCGVLFSVFWKSVQEYLQKHCDAVTRISERCTFMGLEFETADLHNNMAAVYKICSENKNATTGGLLLNYLYTSCNAVQQDCVRKVIISFFYDCCAVYLTKHLERWAFQGCLQSQWSADMFVAINPELSNRRDRSCYSSISLEESQVPKFLTALASRIFSCGKAVWLLKLFDPENKFIHFLDAMKHPKMKICIKEEDFYKLENDFLNYQEDIINLCGPEISFKTFLNVEIDEEEQILRNKELILKKDGYISKKIQEAIEKTEMKRRLYKEQLEAASEARERKLRIKNEEKKREALEYEKMFIEEEKKEIKNKYQSLTDNIEKFINMKEWQNKRFELSEKRMKFLQEDYLNENTCLDKEGNLVSEESTSVFCDSVDGPKKPEDTFSDAEKIKQRNLKSQLILNLSPTKMLVDDSPVEETNKITTPASLKDIVIACLSNKNEKNINLGNNIAHSSIENVKMDLMNRNEPARGLCNIMPLPLVQLNVLNSNQGGTINSSSHKTEAMRNKLKILGTEFNFSAGTAENYTGMKTGAQKRGTNACIELAEAVKNRIKVMGTEFGIVTEQIQGNSTSSTATTVLTEAQINKMKVLGTEYNQPVKNETVIERFTLSEDALRNKMKSLGTDYNFGCSLVANYEMNFKNPKTNDEVDGLPQTYKKDLSEMTEAQRNKLKILGTEFGLPPTTYENKNTGDGPLQKNKLKGMGSDIVFIPETEPAPKSEKHKNYSEVKLPSEDHTEIPGVLPDKPKRDSLNRFLTPTVTEENGILSKIVNYSNPIDSIDTNIDILTLTRNIQRSIGIVIKTQEHLANVFILKHFLLKENLLAHITSIRCYFLLYDGEFSRNLSYGMFQALAQSFEPHNFFDRSLLSNILNEALTYTSIDAQVNANHLSFQILKMPKLLNVHSHDLFSPFQLAYKVQWPLNLIITDPSIDRYRKVFHLLINIKRVHWTLNEAFLLLKAQTKDNALDGIRLMKSPEYTKLATYRYAMTLFVITIEEHISGYGLQVAWIDFMKNLENVSNLDELYQKHVAFVKDLCRRCFLVKASQDLLSYIHELIELGLKFYSILKSGKWHLINDTHYSHPQFTDLKVIFNQFCKATKIFNKTLRKKTGYAEMKIHLPLLELINLKIIV